MRGGSPGGTMALPSAAVLSLAGGPAHPPGRTAQPRSHAPVKRAGSGSNDNSGIYSQTYLASPVRRNKGPWDCPNYVRRWPSFVYPRNMTPKGLGIRAEIMAEPLDPDDNDVAGLPGGRFGPKTDISHQWVSGRDTPGRIPVLRKSRARDPRCSR